MAGLFSKKNPAPIGIDLGTTTSLVSVLQPDGKVRILPNPDGDNYTPSVLAFDDRVYIGQQAIGMALESNLTLVEEFKREMGEAHYPHKVGNYWVPPEVMAGFMLERLKHDAERAIGSVGPAVVTVPAQYDERRRQLTLTAAKLAGLHSVDLINEPTAAALAYLYSNAGAHSAHEFTLPEKKIMVYDLGGGTFDVSILESKGRWFRTLATDGDVRLGGRDFDERLASHVAKQFKAKFGVDPRGSVQSLRKLWLTCRTAKHDLTRHQRASAVCQVGDNRLELEISRIDFEAIIEPLVDRTLFTCGEVLNQAGLTWDDIDDLLLVGGSSRVPFVAECLAAKTGKTPSLIDAPEEAVARGAAIFAATKTGDYLPPLEVVNVSAHSLGVAGYDVHGRRPINKILIPRNTTLPASVTRSFVTRKKGQQTVEVKVLEGESDNPKFCSLVANCVVDIAPNLPEHTEVKVTLRYGANGTVSASAEVPLTRESAHVDVVREGMAEPEPLSTWVDRLVHGVEPVRRGVRTATPVHQAKRTSDQPQDALSLLDAEYAKLGRLCSGMMVVAPAVPVQRSLLAARQQQQSASELQSYLETGAQSSRDSATRAQMQGDAALASLYASQAGSLAEHLEVSLGRECASHNFFPDEGKVDVNRIRALEQQVAEVSS